MNKQRKFYYHKNHGVRPSRVFFFILNLSAIERSSNANGKMNECEICRALSASMNHQKTRTHTFTHLRGVIIPSCSSSYQAFQKGRESNYFFPRSLLSWNIFFKYRSYIFPKTILFHIETIRPLHDFFLNFALHDLHSFFNFSISLQSITFNLLLLCKCI